MAQMTEDLARAVIREYETTGERYPLTAWEMVQLAYFWLEKSGYEIPQKITLPWEKARRLP